MDKRKRREGRQMQNRCQLRNSDNLRVATRMPIVTNSSSRGASKADIKIKLRVEMFRFWRSSGEPPVESNDANDAAAQINTNQEIYQAERTVNTSSTSIPSSSSTATTTCPPTPSQHHSINIPFHASSHLALLTHGTSGHLGATQAEGSRANVLEGTKLWQSLVLPMVLACVIFLVALWARQISRALTNDAIAMMLIMVCIFVVMSGIAFWISCNSFYKSESTHADTVASRDSSPEHFLHHEAVLQEQQAGFDSQREQHHHHCHHASCQLAAGARDLRVGQAQSEKCCHISVINCQPPDYHSALLHSVPIQQYLMFNQDDEELETHQSQFATLHVVNIDGDSILSSGNEGERSEGHEQGKCSPEANAKQLYLFPPRYEELNEK